MDIKKKTIFDYMNSIFYKNDIEFKKRECSGYFLSLWLSHDRNLCKIINEVNKYIGILPDELIYQYFMDKIPKGRRYVKWVKKDPVDKRMKIIEQLAEKHECSIREMELSLI